MKIKKYLSFLAVFFSMTSFGFYRTMIGHAEEAISTDLINTYLIEHGYSEDFVVMAGEQTKLALYEAGAVFEAELPINEGSGPNSRSSSVTDWPGFAHSLVVSDCTIEENYPKKIITYNWDWATFLRVFNDSVGIEWSGGFIALPETALFEIHGVGQIDINRSHSVPGYDPPYVEYENGTFLVERGNDAITSYSPGLGVGHRFAVSSQLTFRRTYGGGSYNTYMINPEDFSGSYSITIIKYIEVNDYNAAAGAYIHWTDDLIVDYSLSFGYPSGISVSLDPEWQYSYEESSEVAVDFQNFV